MKKNEKGFMQEEKNLEKVAGGAMASGVEVETSVKTGDISLVNVNKDDHSKTANADWGVSGDHANQQISGGFSIKM